MTSNKIRDVALHYLANYDYDSFSLNQIANDVGIRKASIYAHYKSKEDIFYAVLMHSIKSGKHTIVCFFHDHHQEPLEKTIKSFFYWFLIESKKNEELKFLLRIMYFPPSNLKNYSSKYTGTLLIELERLLKRYIREKIQKEKLEFSQHEGEIALSFITIAEGCLIELYFADKPRYEQRVEVIFPIFWKGIQ
ncbi:TetR/AcrR family transcriptional regulator [Virgibacillus sp. C22-A2]|uniref:TetR/AcrR family transcriptional regulator n=1 Tax=Virgibacillus tibetensis TaxID=3042313 RepID=A0ABU6KKV1_9BACI|nr:TetR/AcrR family transcriptional regulator [Virgibacillus sp. C22-A2]